MDVLAYVPASYINLYRNLYELFTGKWLVRESTQAKAFIKKFGTTWRHKM